MAEINLEITDSLFVTKEKLVGECAIGKLIGSNRRGLTSTTLKEVEDSLSDCAVRQISRRKVFIQFPFPTDGLNQRLLVGSSEFDLTSWSPAVGATPEKKSWVWIALKNVPFHAWTPAYFAKMVEGFGRVLDVHRKTLTMENMKEARIKVEVFDGAVVPENLRINLLGRSYLVSVSLPVKAASGSRRRRRRRRERRRCRAKVEEEEHEVLQIDQASFCGSL